MVAIFGEVTDQSTKKVMSLVEPSEYMPVALIGFSTFNVGDVLFNNSILKLSSEAATTSI
ncbi:hypothetical protein VoSk93_43430 [Vibrio owensii]